MKTETNNTETPKQEQYAKIILGKITELFDPNSDNWVHITLEELADDENATHFLHALTNIVPTVLYNKMTAKDVDILEVNHIANRLIHQYSNTTNND